MTESAYNLQAIKSFVPTIIQREVEKDPSPIHSPRYRSFESAIIFADISGFTSATETFAKEGQLGIEKLTEGLNEYFHQLIKLINEHGGDIIQFSGDALLAVWPAEYFKEDSTILIRRAAQCAADITKRLGQFQITNDLKLSIRVSLGSGEISLVRLGGVQNVWHLLIVGAPLAQLNIAHHQTDPGSTTVSLQAWARLQPFANGVQMLSGAVSLSGLKEKLPLRRLESPDLSSASLIALESSLPIGIKERLRCGQVDWLGEVRRVTVVFVNLPDLNYATPVERSQECIRLLQSAIFSYSGTINKISVDEKGANVVVGFGMPPFSGSDDPTRAVQAAMHLQSELRKIGARNSIGVATGQAFCGWVGSHLRREYTLVGDIVNLAARLMQSAADEILCEYATYKVAQESLLFERLSAITVKGKNQSFAVFRPKTSSDSEVKKEIWMIDRVSQRNQIREAFKALIESAKSDTIFIVGEAGIGKSLLIQFASLESLQFRLKPLMGAGSMIERDTQFFPWRDIFKSLAQLNLQKASEEVHHQVMKLLERLGVDSCLAPLLNTVLELDMPDTELTGAMIGKVRADNTIELLLHILKVLAPSPSLILLEDIHWFDQSSLQLLSQLRGSLDKTLLIITSRPVAEPAPEILDGLFSSPEINRVVLDPFNENDSSALICRRLGVGFVPDFIHKEIMLRANGHPLFTEQLACALKDSGLIVWEDGNARVVGEEQRLAPIDLPESVNAVIRSRLDRLASTNQQLLLKVASVIGKSADFDLLFAIFPVRIERDSLTRDILQLVSEGFLVKEENPIRSIYSFKHELIREVTYSSMLKSQRQKLHECVALWYEENDKDNLQTNAPILAYHWENAGEEAKAIFYLEKSAELAAKVGAFEEASNFLRKLLKISEQTVVKISKLQLGHWKRLLGETLLGLGKLAESRDQLEKAAGILSYGVPKNKAGLYCSIAFLIIKQTCRRTGIFRGRIKKARDRTTAKEAALCHLQLLELCYFADDTAGLAFSTLSAADISESTGATLELAASFGVITDLFGIIGLQSIAKLYLHLTRERLSQIQDLSARARILKYMVLYCIGVGDWQSVQQPFLEALNILDRIGDKLQWAQVQGMHGQMHFWRGDFKKCVTMHEDLYQIGRAHKSEQYLLWGLVWKAIGKLRLGELEEAIRLLEESFDIEVPVEDTGTSLTMHGVMAVALAYSGEYDAALASAERGLQVIRGKSSNTFYSLDGYSCINQAIFLIWEHFDLNLNRKSAEAKRLANEGVIALKKFSRAFHIGRAWSLYAQGRLAYLSGKSKKAVKLWKKCIQEAIRLDLPYEEAIANFALSKAEPEPLRQKALYLKKAKEIFNKHECSYEVQMILRAEQQIAKTKPARK